MRDYRLLEVGIIPLGITIIVILFLDIICHEPDQYIQQKENLLLVQIIFANGEQEQSPFLPTSPTDSDIYWLNESSVLSLQGQKRAYKLGKIIKNLYQLYLRSNEFSSELVESTTGYLNIFQASLQCVHAGLFPTFPGSQIININLDWRPVPYIVLSKNDDELLYQIENVKQLRNIRIGNDSNGTLLDAFNIMKTKLGFNASLSDSVMIHDYLMQKWIYNEIVTMWEEEPWSRYIKDLQLEFWNEYAHNQKYAAVPLLNLFLKNIKNKITDKLPPKRRLHLYSGQKLNIVILLSALGVFDDDSSINPTSITWYSYILIELVQNIKTKFYSVYFYYQNGNKLEQPIPFKPKQCANLNCTIFEFTKIVNSITFG